MVLGLFHLSDELIRNMLFLSLRSQGLGHVTSSQMLSDQDSS